MSKPSQEIDIQKKWGTLWAEKRTLRVRMLMAALCAFAFAFTFIIFGPCEIYAGNPNDMPFPFSALVPMLLLAGTVVFGGLLGVLFLLRGKVYDIALSLLFAVTVSGYIQGNFLNLDHGALDGKEIRWLYYKWPMIWDLLFWFLIFGVVFALLYFSQKIWSQTTGFISVLLIVMQSVALCFLLPGFALDSNLEKDMKRYLSTDGIYELAPKNNVIFFLLDRCDRIFIDDLLAQHSEWVEQLNGFVSYRDFVGSFSRTYPSIAYLLTGVQERESMPFMVSRQDYLSQAWKKTILLPEIHESGAQIGLYTDFSSVVGVIDNVDEMVDNIGTERVLVDREKMLKKMLDLSAYRYLPEAMKPYFQIYTGDLREAIFATEDNMYRVDDYRFWDNYRKTGLTVNEKLKGTFRFYHLQGAHPPFNINENAEYDTENTRDAQLTGNLNMILQYIDEMKRKGIYDETTIIISTDHAVDYPNVLLSELDTSRILPLLIKPAHTDLSTPLQVSDKQISQDNLRASIASYFDLDSEKYGRTIESIGENEPMTRTFWMLLYDETLQKRDANMGAYAITGNGNDFSNWHLVETLVPNYPE